MSHAADAVLRDDQGRAVLRFERTFPHPPERAWAALTDPGEMAAWHPSPFELEPQVGETVSYLPNPEIPEMPDGEVIEYDPPRLLAHTWGDDHLRWALRPHDDGCLLVLTHTFDDRFKAARDATGWHLCLEALATTLDGTLTGEPFPAEAGAERVIPSGWRDLNRAYEERFEIPPDKATPPPEGYS
ncbi:MAG: SRPBCC family protein [Solirubrobacterales bacterium]